MLARDSPHSGVCRHLRHVADDLEGRRASGATWSAGDVAVGAPLAALGGQSPTHVLMSYQVPGPLLAACGGLTGDGDARRAANTALVFPRSCTRRGQRASWARCWSRCFLVTVYEGRTARRRFWRRWWQLRRNSLSRSMGSNRSRSRCFLVIYCP